MSKPPSAAERQQLARLLEELRRPPGTRTAPANQADPAYQADLAKAVQVLKEAGLGHLLHPEPSQKRKPERPGLRSEVAQATWGSGKAGCRHGLKPGDILNNQQLQTIFQCSPQGGMRRSLKTNSLVLISNHTQGIYNDRWQDGCFHYTGMGLEGDQSLTFAQNKTLAESRENGVEVFLFEVFTKGQYTFLGRVALAGEPYQEVQKDRNGQERRVWMFPLKILD